MQPFPTLAASEACSPGRARVLLLATDPHVRASICHQGQHEQISFEPVSSLAEISLREYTSADVLLAWDEGDVLGQLKAQLAIIGSWLPIIAISEDPSAEKVVRALLGGAINYIDWTGEIEPVRVAIRSAAEFRRMYLHRYQRQAEGRRLLQSLSKRERQVLLGVTQGMSNKDIGKVLCLSSRTVEIHRANMMRKLDARHTADAVRVALDSSLAPDWIHSENCTAPWAIDEPLLSHLGDIED